MILLDEVLALEWHQWLAGSGCRPAVGQLVGCAAVRPSLPDLPDHEWWIRTQLVERQCVLVRFPVHLLVPLWCTGAELASGQVWRGCRWCALLFPVRVVFGE